MNAAELYREAIAPPPVANKDTPTTDEAVEERNEKENFELLYLNWKISPVTRHLFSNIQVRIDALNEANTNLALGDEQKNASSIRRNLIAISILKSILNFNPLNETHNLF